MTKPLCIGINAQIIPNAGWGGIETVLLELAAALAQLDGNEKYIFITHWQAPDWLRPHLGPNQALQCGPRLSRLAHVAARLPSALSRANRPLQRIWGRTRAAFAPVMSRTAAPAANFYDALPCAVVHFPYQQFTPCRQPIIFNPHDLQHRHWPQFFTPAELARRDELFPAGCQAAQTVVVASQWVKQDLIQQYAVPPDKIQVIPWAAPAPLSDVHADNKTATQELTEVAAVRRKYDLPEVFALYPAATWEHKNHLRLLEAVALLRDRRGVRVNLVCSGFQTPHWARLAERLSALNLQEQVRFTGAIPRHELTALYRAAQFVALPTLFEAVSAPIFESWQASVPVMCSAVTALPEQTADAALLFDPHSVTAIADALARLTNEPRLREHLRTRGTERLQVFSLERTGRAYRAVYRRAAGVPLDAEDAALLQWDWMRGQVMNDE